MIDGAIVQPFGILQCAYLREAESFDEGLTAQVSGGDADANPRKLELIERVRGYGRD